MTMNTSMRELISAISVIAQEKGISEESVQDAICDGIVTSLRKNFPETSLLKIEIDRDQGMIRGFRLFNLVEQIEDVNCQMLFNEITDEVVIDNVVYEEFPVDLNRQQVNITKQVTLSKIRTSSQHQQVANLLRDEFNIFSGTVKVSRRDEYIVECRGQHTPEAVDLSVPKSHCLPRDTYSVGDKIFFTIIPEKNGWIGSRTDAQFLVELFKSKIPEVASGVVEVVSCARNPGFRAKVVVKSNEPRVNALAACIGPRGANIKNINNFMNNENVDVIEYDEDIATLLVNALAPVNVNGIVLDEDEHLIEISFPDDLIAQAIGKGGKNIDLVSRLLGWKIDAYSETKWQEKNGQETRRNLSFFMHALNCNEELAEILLKDGFTDLESIIYTPTDEFSELETELVNELKSNAQETLDNKDKLEVIKGMVHLESSDVSEEEIQTLQKASVYSLQDIADLATDEFLDILPDFDKEKASAIIMKARELTQPEVEEAA